MEIQLSVNAHIYMQSLGDMMRIGGSHIVKAMHLLVECNSSS
jgi:hypothetical protein